MSEQPIHGAVPDWTLGWRLARALQYGNVSKDEMADYLRVSRNTVGNYVADRTKVPHAVVLMWALRTGVDPDWLEKGINAGPAPTPPPSGVTPELRKLTDSKRSRARRAPGAGTHRYRPILVAA